MRALKPRDLGSNLDVLESRLIDLLNETFGDPEATARFMERIRAKREEIHGRGRFYESGDCGSDGS
jgi:hypothetical protein